jgi:hypothetical protein
MSKFYYLLLITSLFFLISCDDEESTDPSRLIPVVTILRPTDNSAIIDSAIIEATATDDNTVARVELYINDQTDSNKIFSTPPYRYLWDVSELPDSSTHTIFAKVYDNDGKFGTSEIIHVTVLTFAPTNLRMGSMDDKMITLRWNDNSSIEKGFEVQMSIDGYTYTTVDTVDKNKTSTTIRRTFAQYTPYYFRVRAITDSIVSKFSNTLSAVVGLLSPGNLTIVSITDSTVQLQWQDRNTDETGFEIELSEGGTNFTLVKTTNPNITSTTIISSFERMKNYFFRVRTKANTIFSGYSNQVRIYYLSALYAGGSFTIVNDIEANRIAEWNNSVWRPLGSGLNGSVYSMSEYQSKLFVGGTFTEAGGISANGIATWDGLNWSSVENGVNGNVKSLSVFQSELYVGGDFTSAGGISVNNIARWNGSSWNSVGNGLNGTVNALKAHEGELYAGGNFTLSGSDTLLHLARWDGSTWRNVGVGTHGPVYALCSTYRGLYVGGDFKYSGTINSSSITLWHNSIIDTNEVGVNNTVYAIEKTAFGGVYIGGKFTKSAENDISKVAMGGVGSWFPLEDGLVGDVSALLSIQLNLYVSENYSLAKGLTTNRIMKWDSYNWSVVGTGLNSATRTLCRYGSWHW